MGLFNNAFFRHAEQATATTGVRHTGYGCFLL
jgi:hypothetical protein